MSNYPANADVTHPAEKKDFEIIQGHSGAVEYHPYCSDCGRKLAVGELIRDYRTRKPSLDGVYCATQATCDDFRAKQARAQNMHMGR